MVAKKAVKKKSASNKAAKKKSASNKAAKAKQGLRTVNLQDHCEAVRKTLVALYKQSMNATHPVVQGTLREGFVRQVLGGFLGRSASWSSGQVVGTAPKNSVSGQMDILLHDDVLPQVYMYDGTLCLVPHEALFGAIEVKSNLTTDRQGKSVLDQALDSLVDAMRVCGDSTPRPAFVVTAFYSGQKRATLVSKVVAYMQRNALNPDDYWPDAIVILSGAKAHPDGVGLFRDCLSPGCGTTTNAAGLTKDLWVVDGGDALSGLVALLSKRRVSRSATFDSFDFAKYIFRPSATPSATPGSAATPPPTAAASA